jgi:hypothetical protein
MDRMLPPVIVREPDPERVPVNVFEPAEVSIVSAPVKEILLATVRPFPKLKVVPVAILNVPVPSPLLLVIATVPALREVIPV